MIFNISKWFYGYNYKKEYLINNFKSEFLPKIDFEEQKITFDYVVLLEPTSPLTDSVDLDLAIKKLETNCKYADSIVGVSKNVNHHPDYNVKMKKKF